VQVDSIKICVESAYVVFNQRLKLQHQSLLSTFAFNFNLRRCTKDLLDGFKWGPAWKESFDNLAGQPLFVPPVLQVLAFPRRPDEAGGVVENQRSTDVESNLLLLLLLLCTSG
jgi:hypothetical protein